MIAPFPSNTVLIVGTSGVVSSCTSTDGPDNLSWSYLPVGGSTTVYIGTGSKVVAAQNQTFRVDVSGLQSNLLILSAAMARAGTYYCNQGASQASAQLIIISKLSVNEMEANIKIFK